MLLKVLGNCIDALFVRNSICIYGILFSVTVTLNAEAPAYRFYVAPAVKFLVEKRKTSRFKSRCNIRYDLVYLKCRVNIYQSIGGFAMTNHSKQQWRIFAVLVVVMLAFVSIFIVNHFRNMAEHNATTALKRLLTCTTEDASSIIEALNTNSGSDTVLRTLMFERYSAFATDECILNLMANRSILRCVFLAEKYGSDINAENLELKKASTSSESYAFSSDLIASGCKTKIAHVTGSIVMEKTSAGFVAKRISLNIKES